MLEDIPPPSDSDLKRNSSELKKDIETKKITLKAQLHENKFYFIYIYLFYYYYYLYFLFIYFNINFILFKFFIFKFSFIVLIYFLLMKKIIKSKEHR